MNNKSLRKLSVVALILVIICVVLYNNKKQSWENNSIERDTLLIKEFDVNSVNKIIVSFVDNSTTIEKKDSEWLLSSADNYPADFEKIKENLLSLEELRITQVLNIKDDEYEVFNFGDKDSLKQPIKLELFNDKNSKIETIIFGNYHFAVASNKNPYLQKSEANGRYIKRLSNDNKVYIINDLFKDMMPMTPVWMKKTFLSLNNPRRIKYENKTASINWDIIRPNETTTFVLLKPRGEMIEDKNINDFLHNLFNPMFHNVKKFTELNDKDEIIGTVSYENFKNIIIGIKIIKTEKKLYLKYDIDTTNVARIKDEEKKKKILEQAEKDKFYTKWLFQIDEKFLESLNKTILKIKPPTNNTTQPAK